MFPATRSLKVTFAMMLFVTACGVIKNDDHEKEVRDFLTAFQSSLQRPAPAVINEFFTANQDKQTLIQALIVLQNKDSAGIKCRAEFALASITFYEKIIEVRIPVSFKENGIPEEEHLNTETQLIFFLERGKKKLIINEVDGSDFYQTYTAVKNYKQWSDVYKKELANRERIYALADSLEQSIDSVIWFASSGEKTFFYAVTGSWENSFMNKSDEEGESFDYRMGLLDANGDTLIPFDFELIGTVGFVKPPIVEIKHDGKYGYFDLDSGKVVVEPLYDMIIPYEYEGSDAQYLVLQDTTYGWLSSSYQYTEGYPTDHARTFAADYIYLQTKIVLKAGNQIFCEIPSKEHIGYGIIIPPSYYVKNKIFDQIVGGINTTAVPMNGWTDYIESSKSMVARIGEGIHALISVLSERYIGGREEFYGASQVTFVNENEEIMLTTEMPTDQAVEFRHVGGGLLEVKASDAGYSYWTPGNEKDIPVYKFFQIVSETELEELTSTRIFNFTEFVKLDSAYITGTFAIIAETEAVYDEPVEEAPAEEYTDETVETEEEYSEESTEEETTGDAQEEAYVEEEYYEDYYEEPSYEYIDILTLETLRLMRDEIGAVYGLRPADAANASRFEQQHMTLDHTSLEEVEDSFSEIDRHNYDFLSRVIEAIENGENSDSGV